MTTQNRLTRDQILNQALDLMDSPTLDQHDRPNAPTIDAGAFSISWLQNALDRFHQVFPWAGLVKAVPITLAQGNPAIALPSDFLLDVRDGIVIPQPQNPLSNSGLPLRLFRTSLQKFMDFQALSPSAPGLPAGSGGGGGGTPRRYMVMPGAVVDINTGLPMTGIALWPTPNQDYSASLWYYSLPQTLNPTDVPNFPSDEVLVDTVRVRGLEWSRAVPLGTYRKYVNEMIAELRKSGLGQEPESYEIPFDPIQFRRGQDSAFAWMGDFSTKI